MLAEPERHESAWLAARYACPLSSIRRGCRSLSGGLIPVGLGRWIRNSPGLLQGNVALAKVTVFSHRTSASVKRMAAITARSRIVPTGVKHDRTCALDLIPVEQRSITHLAGHAGVRLRESTTPGLAGSLITERAPLGARFLFSGRSRQIRHRPDSLQSISGLALLWPVAQCPDTKESQSPRRSR